MFNSPRSIMTKFRLLLLPGLFCLLSLTLSAHAAPDAHDAHGATHVTDTTHTTASSATLPAAQESRGALLYDLHCSACHAKELHWRTPKKLTTLNSLQQEVRRWSDSAKTRWNEADLREVTRYLNTSYYHFPTD